jgi:Uma2 family endonuclease
LNEFVEGQRLGIVMTAPTRVRIDDRHYREPDVLFVANKNIQRRHEQYWEAIDLAVEIVSPDDPDRDLIDKRNDYAVAGVPEYWIIDPRDDSITVLCLDGGNYEVLARESDGCVASKLLADFQIDVKKMFAEARSR